VDKVFLKVALVLIIVAVAGNIILFMMGVSPFNLVNVNVKKTVTPEDIRNLQVTTDTEDIELVTYSGKDIQVLLHGKTTKRWEDDYELQIERNNGELTISVHEKTKQKFFVIYTSIKLTIQVPKNMMDQIHILTDTGDTTINQVVAKEFRLNSDTGSVNADVDEGKFDIATDTGDILLQLKNITSDISAKTDTGDITIIVAEAPVNLQYQLETEDGNQETDFPQSVSDEGGPRVNLTSDTGDLKLIQR